MVRTSSSAPNPGPPPSGSPACGSLRSPHGPDTQHVPCPFPQLLLPRELVGRSGRNFWPRVRGGAPAGGRRHAHARDRSEFQLPRACWERARRGAGEGQGAPLLAGRAQGMGEAGSPCGRGRSPVQSPDGKTEAPWCHTLSSGLFLRQALGGQGCCGRQRGWGASL